MMVVTVASVIGRALFDRPVPDIVTIDEMFMAFAVFLPLAYAQLNQEHVSVTIFTDWMPVRSLSLIKAFGLLLSSATWAVLGWAMFFGAYRAWETGDVYLGEMSIPTWGARTVAALGVSFFVIRLLLDLKDELRSRPTVSPELDERSNVNVTEEHR
jgi:TRAP-type C4-dicarboxylate transport system permease small subunit